MALESICDWNMIHSLLKIFHNYISWSFMIEHLFESALWSSGRAGGGSGRGLFHERAVDLADWVPFVSLPSHKVLFHFELEAAIISKEGWVLSLFILCGHQRRVAFLVSSILIFSYEWFPLRSTYIQTLSILDCLRKFGVFGEELMIQCFCCIYSSFGVFLQKPFQQIQPFRG